MKDTGHMFTITVHWVRSWISRSLVRRHAHPRGTVWRLWSAWPIIHWGSTVNRRGHAWTVIHGGSVVTVVLRRASTLWRITFHHLLVLLRLWRILPWATPVRGRSTRMSLWNWGSRRSWWSSFTTSWHHARLLLLLRWRRT